MLAGVQLVDKMEAAQLNEEFDKVLALIPMAKEQEPLEEIATNLDIDVTAEVAAGNKRAIQRKILNVLNSQDFDEHADRERLILSARDTLNGHLGFTDPKVDHDSESDDDSSDNDNFKDAKADADGGSGKGQVTVLSGVRLKDFKFDGSVGHPGEKGKLDYAGVMHNIKWESSGVLTKLRYVVQLFVQ